MSDSLNDYMIKERRLEMAAANLSQNQDFKLLFLDKFEEKKRDLLADLGVPHRYVDSQNREQVVLELSHIAYLENYINQTITNQ